MNGINGTITANFETIIAGRKKFIIPKFQRDYSWGLEQWDDLWQDIQTAREASDDHYMGYLVLQNQNGDKSNYIIDGQQRITTINIIILACIKCIKKLAESGVDVDDNKLRVDRLVQNYIGTQHIVTLAYDTILHLNKNNNDYYRDYIVKLGRLPVSNLTSSNRLLKESFEFYEEQLSNSFQTGKELAEFVTFVVDKLFFTIITVSDEINAFKVFETLNARGVQLSSSDLLKNYLFSLVDKNYSHHNIFDELEKTWSTLNSNIKENQFSEFIRCYWNAKYNAIRSNELFKIIRKTITNAPQVFELLNDMLEYCDIYSALKDPNDNYWANNYHIPKMIEILNLLEVKQAYSLLMASNKYLTTKQFEGILKDIIAVSFRYSVICGKNPNYIEKVYNNIANTINSTRVYNKSMLEEVYVSDNEFVSVFNNKSFVDYSKANKKVRYILNEINIYNGGTNVDIYDFNTTIEHILPQSPTKYWCDIFDNIDFYIYRLGNMCLLEKSLNKDIANNSYEEKIDILSNSDFLETSTIPERYEEWNKQSLVSRQSQMGKIAKGIWKLQF